MSNKPRVGCAEWVIERPDAIGIYNTDYSPSGKSLGRSMKPWAVLGAEYDRFATYSEAVTHAFKEARK